MGNLSSVGNSDLFPCVWVIHLCPSGHQEMFDPGSYQGVDAAVLITQDGEELMVQDIIKRPFDIQEYDRGRVTHTLNPFHAGQEAGNGRVVLFLIVRPY
jgi:hypothetical protein